MSTNISEKPGFLICNFEFNYMASCSTGHYHISDIRSQVFINKIHKFHNSLLPHWKHLIFDVLRVHAKSLKSETFVKFRRQTRSFSGTNKYGSNPPEVLRQHALQTARGCLILQRPHIKYGYTARLMLYIPICYSKSDPRRCLIESPESGGMNTPYCSAASKFVDNKHL